MLCKSSSRFLENFYLTLMSSLGPGHGISQSKCTTTHQQQQLFMDDGMNVFSRKSDSRITNVHLSIHPTIIKQNPSDLIYEFYLISDISDQYYNCQAPGPGQVQVQVMPWSRLMSRSMSRFKLAANSKLNFQSHNLKSRDLERHYNQMSHPPPPPTTKLF